MRVKLFLKLHLKPYYLFIETRVRKRKQIKYALAYLRPDNTSLARRRTGPKATGCGVLSVVNFLLKLEALTSFSQGLNPH